MLEIHYTANGKEALDRSELGLYLAKQPPRQRAVNISPAGSKFVIPPGDANSQSFTAATLRGRCGWFRCNRTCVYAGRLTNFRWFIRTDTAIYC